MHMVTFVTTSCTREAFISSDLYDEHFDTSGLLASYDGGKQVRVPCHVGYSGFYRIRCIEGRWESVGEKCKARSCGHPGEAQFAEFQLVKGTDFVFGAQVEYTCHKGFQMVSRINYRRCMAEGWDGAIPVCEAQRCPVIRVENNVRVIGDTEESTFGNVVRFSCKQSNEMLTGPTELYCNDHGEWAGQDSDQNPKCEEVRCSRPQEAYLDYWSGSWWQSTLGDTSRYTCRQGYKKPDGVSWATCTRDGWIPKPLCKAPECEAVGVANGFTVGPYKDKLYYACNDGYKPFTKGWWGEAKCKTGHWSRFRCIANGTFCSPPHKVLNAVITSAYQKEYTSDSEVTYQCRDKYIMEETFNAKRTIRCTKGQWDNDNIKCTAALSCGRPPVLVDGDIASTTQSEYRHDQKVKYMCQNLYKMEGGPFKTCNNGEWTGEIRCLKPCTVNEDDMNSRNIRFRYKDDDKLYAKHLDHLTFECIRGRPINNVAMRQQCVDGEMTLPECQEMVVVQGDSVLGPDVIAVAAVMVRRGWSPLPWDSACAQGSSGKTGVCYASAPSPVFFPVSRAS
ncbi:complement factor H-like [Pholidichthys leucotaenia]